MKILGLSGSQIKRIGREVRTRRRDGDTEARLARAFELDKLQLQLAIDTYKAQYTLLVALVTALVGADVTFLGYAIRDQNGWICLLGLFFAFAVFAVRRIVYEAMLPVIFTAISIESKYSERSDEPMGLMTTFVSMSLGSPRSGWLKRNGQDSVAADCTSALVELARAEMSHAKRMRLLRDCRLPGLSRSLGGRILIMAAMVHISLGVGFLLAPYAFRGPKSVANPTVTGVAPQSDPPAERRFEGIRAPQRDSTPDFGKQKPKEGQQGKTGK